VSKTSAILISATGGSKNQMTNLRYIGKVCAKHPELSGERRRPIGRCVGCQRELSRRWREKNPDRRRENFIRWHQENPGKAKEYAQRQLDRDLIKMLVRNAARRAAKKAAAVRLTAIERARVQEFYDIARARTAQTGIAHHVDHDRPLVRGGQHHPDNLLVVPAAVNLAKGARYDSVLAFILS
jgi:hypothetical protein